MRAARFHRYGGPEELRVEDVPEPHATAGTVRVRVLAAGVNPIDWKLRRGDLRGVVDPPLPLVPGRDAVGVVDEVGEGVDDVTTGDTVFGSAGLGGLSAEHAVLTAWAPPASTWSVEQAASAGLAMTTAVHALAAVGVLGPGTSAPGPVGRAGGTVLVEGASGSVGAAAVVAAVAAGARVVGTARPENHRVLEEMGAVPVAHGPGLAGRVAAVAPEGVDVVLDAAGADLDQLVALVGDPAHVVTVVDPVAAGRLGALVAGGENDVAALRAAAALGEQGLYRPRVGRTFPLEEAAAAHRLAEGGFPGGKVVLDLRR